VRMCVCWIGEEEVVCVSWLCGERRRVVCRRRSIDPSQILNVGLEAGICFRRRNFEYHEVCTVNCVKSVAFLTQLSSPSYVQRSNNTSPLWRFDRFARTENLIKQDLIVVFLLCWIPIVGRRW
jgi:hypothetical protein